MSGHLKKMIRFVYVKEVNMRCLQGGSLVYGGSDSSIEGETRLQRRRLDYTEGKTHMCMNIYMGTYRYIYIAIYVCLYVCVYV